MVAAGLGVLGWGGPWVLVIAGDPTGGRSPSLVSSALSHSHFQFSMVARA